MRNDFSIVIPTYKREASLQMCLDSILCQTIVPSELFLLDDDALGVFFLNHYQELFSQHDCRFVYHKKDLVRELRGTSVSRNIGMNLATHEIVFVLDDDLVLDKTFCENILFVWEQEEMSKIVGVGGVISNNRKKTAFENAFHAFFGLTSKQEWDVTDVGFQVWNDGLEKRTKGFFSHGGACSYKRSVVQELGGFKQINPGRAELEDVEFALRAKQHGYGYIMEPNAQTEHHHAPSGRESNFLTGWRSSQNRRAIFQTLCQQDWKHCFWFSWSMFGWILRQLLSGHIQTATGMFIGLFLPLS